MAGEQFFTINYSRESLEAFVRACTRAINDPKNFARTAYLRALNDQARPMKNLGRALVEGHYTLKESGLRARYERATRVIGATLERPYIVFRAETGRAIPIGDYRTKTYKRQGVFAQPVEGGKFSPVRLTSRGAPVHKGFWFVAPNSGKRLVAMRVEGRRYLTKARTRVREVKTKTMGRRTWIVHEKPHYVMGFRKLLGPDVVAWLGQKDSYQRQALLDGTFAKFRNRFIHHLEFYLSRGQFLRYGGKTRSGRKLR